MKPERPVFIGEGESTNMLDVLPQKLTLRRISKKFYPSNGNRAKNTIFREVSIKPYQQSEEVTELINRPRKYYTHIKELYKSSYFGRKYDVTPTPQITYSKWWFYFNAASWCQHLIEKGYTIR